MEKQKIGWIGTGIMGKSMCSHVIDAGYEAFVFNRTKSKADELVAKGAVWCKSAAEVASKADIVFTIVGYPKDVRQVYFGDEGCFAADVKGKVFIDMTTTEPTLAQEIFKRARILGADALDAPVSGGDRGAREATLSIMAGGDRDAFEKVLPILNVMGKSVIYEGKAGAGQHTKMANQIVIAGTMAGVSEAMVYASSAGLDIGTMLKTIGGGAAGCWTLANLAPRVEKGDFKPGFMIDHFVKDMRIAISEAQNMGLRLPALELVCSEYEDLQSKGLGKLGTQALVKEIGGSDVH
jgi:3-hydroxyisobutyrate dehydrogenase